MRSRGRCGSLLLGVMLVLCAGVTAADESSIVLADGPGRDKVQAFCSMCHSLDYIVMNSPFQDKTGWEKTVKKMVTVMGAPLTAEVVFVIVAYLDGHYGSQPAAVALH